MMETPLSLQRVMEFEAHADPAEFVLSRWRVPMWSVVRSYIAGALYDAIAGTNFQKKGGARARPGAGYFYRTWAGRNGSTPARQPLDGVYIATGGDRSEEHTSELQSLMRLSYAVFCLKKKNIQL